MQQQSIRRECFFVGGQYEGPPAARIMQGQMYVEALLPQTPLHETPIVFIHGRGQTAANWISTPDGRPGWAEWFANEGWRVYLLDQPARGRSAWQPNINGPLHSIPTVVVERAFTAIAEQPLWPQAILHTQWPGGAGKGKAGDPYFDQYYASMVSSLSRSESEQLFEAAGRALLERIGPAALLGHSQGGTACWIMADRSPKLVRAVIAIEPTGPPFRDIPSPIGTSDGDRSSGLTSSQLTYDPAITENSSLEFEQEAQSDDRALFPCWSQKTPARKLSKLSPVPVLVVTGEASYHAAFDHCTVRYLRAASVTVRHLLLGDVGIHGNGHMMMVEKNNADIAALLQAWLADNVT